MYMDKHETFIDEKFNIKTFHLPFIIYTNIFEQIGLKTTKLGSDLEANSFISDIEPLGRQRTPAYRNFITANTEAMEKSVSSNSSGHLYKSFQ